MNKANISNRLLKKKEKKQRIMDFEETLRLCKDAGIAVSVHDEKELWKGKRERQKKDIKDVKSGRKSWKEMSSFDLEKIGLLT